MDRIDAVVIGRNEGARLAACLASLQGRVRRVVYVDSGSTDGSVILAQAAGAEVVALDMARPFTAARARNAGLARLAADPPDAVQMLDGDCAMQPGWLVTAQAFLEAHPGVAAVCGRRRERAPEATIYNRLCDLEWDTPVGEVRACGGDALVRWAAISAIGGYRDDVIAAEDDEMCQRLRKAGWQIHRLGAEMCWHDAAITRFGQWWRRSVRAGHGFAQVGALHSDHFTGERRRVLVWGLLLPALALIGLAVAPVLVLAVAGLYLLSFVRVARRFRAVGLDWPEAAGCAGLIVLSKLPNLQGALTWLIRRARGRAATIIEYK